MKVLLFVLVGIFVFGCASPDLTVDSISMTKNPGTEIKRLERSLAKAKDKDVHQLSPDWYRKSVGSLLRARTINKKGNQIRKTLEMISFGRAQLRKAEETARVSRFTLKSLIEIRDRALEAGATSNTKGFKVAEEGFLEMTRNIEKGNVDWANDNKGRVTEDYLAVELRAIKNKALGPTRKTLKTARETNVRKWAPKTLAQAEKDFLKTDKYITLDRHNKDKIASLADKALFMAERAISVALFSKFVSASEPEDVALWVETNTNKVAGAIGEDFRNQSLEEQFLSLRREVNTLRGSKTELSDLKIKSVAKRKELEKLQRVRDFNKKFVSVRGYFKKSEAEVYKQDGRLVIRLKGVQFPSGRAALLSRNYPLIAKVKRAIQIFKNANVIVEGHTDSLGSAKTNFRLSKARANSVRDYILANSTLSNKRIKSVGMGFRRPIASNKTEKGRSSNRRIDIIIQANLKEEVN